MRIAGKRVFILVVVFLLLSLQLFTVRINYVNNDGFFISLTRLTNPWGEMSFLGNEMSSSGFVDLRRNRTTTTTREEVTSSWDFNQSTGGIVIFYHVAKTGGTTIRNLFQQVVQTNKDENIRARNIYRIKNPQFEYRRYGRRWKKKRKSYHCHPNVTEIPIPNEFIQSRLQRGTTILFEIHGGVPGLPEWIPIWERWKEMVAFANGGNSSSLLLSDQKPLRFWTFTLLRDPFEHSKSYFDFFHTSCFNKNKKERFAWCERPQFDPNKDWIRGYQQTMQRNRQCFLFHRLSGATEGMPKQCWDELKVRDRDCDETALLLQHHMNWIGTTEQLSRDTIPLLHYLFGTQNSNRTLENGKVRTQSYLPTTQELDKLKRFSQLHSKRDQIIYDTLPMHLK